MHLCVVEVLAGWLTAYMYAVVNSAVVLLKSKFQVLVRTL